VKAAVKKSAVVAWEAARQALLESQANKTKNASFVEKLVASVINNLQV
jgi:hypothetical protein